jgi:hypothetical protein
MKGKQTHGKCSTRGVVRNRYKMFFGISQGKNSLETPKPRREDNVKTHPYGKILSDALD